MSKSQLDYSKWDHIEVSDDEDDTHPNIDTPSLFRWRHQARMGRMAERKKERENLENERQHIEDARKRLMEQTLDDADKKETVEKLEDLEKQEKEWKKKEEELMKKEKEEPWNVDTICKEGFSKSMINKQKNEEKEPLTAEEKNTNQNMYMHKYEKELKTFGMLSKASDSQKYLQDHSHLVSDKAANFLVIWSIDLEVEEKHALVDIVAHQTVTLQFILELARTLKRDPRHCFITFFDKFKEDDPTYKKGFLNELHSFKERVKDRAKMRIQSTIEEIETEEREKRIGPGRLDPHEVFDSLPKAMQKCFEKREVSMLQKVVMELDPEEAKYHMKRCVDAGLWVPGTGGPKKERDVSEIYDEVEVESDSAEETIQKEEA